ncbi:uncharacterized protein PFLUO_LOCUS6758 [Penicillium psychrofluorescens]|uniref:uncharacterized protein n=1 Tax=Penicillium psychrofluorescens TaxID=3158075 RepID=UPI003CCCA9FC
MRRRKYATASNFPSREYSWPTATSFTPYDVFNLQRDASYSKNRYYDLVKIYHPDRPSNDPLSRGLTPAVRLQRYRIIVAAHEILSDPSKRAAYDLHGTGWVHGPKRYNTVAEATAEWGPYGSTIYANATWEDWERWHNRDQGPQRHFVDHRTFTRLVVLLLLFGGAVNASWIGHVSNGYEQRLQEVNEETTRLLIGRRHNTVHQMDSNDARVQGFLIRRDPSGSGLQDGEQSIYQKELSPRSRDSAGPEHAQTVDAAKSDST